MYVPKGTAPCDPKTTKRPLADAHIHVFASGYTPGVAVLRSDAASYDKVARELGIEAALVVGYAGEPWALDNNEHILSVSRSCVDAFNCTEIPIPFVFVCSLIHAYTCVQLCTGCCDRCITLHITSVLVMT